MEVTSEAGIMSGRELFNVGMQKGPVQSSSSMQGMRLAYTPDGTMIYKPITTCSPPPRTYQGGGGGGAGGGGGEGGSTGGGGGPSPVAITPHDLNINIGEPMKQKRGRPRNYGLDGTMALTLTTVSPTATVSLGSGGFPPSSSGQGTLPLWQRA